MADIFSFTQQTNCQTSNPSTDLGLFVFVLVSRSSFLLPSDQDRLSLSLRVFFHKSDPIFSLYLWEKEVFFPQMGTPREVK